MGDEFTVSKKESSNGLVGIGYYVPGQERAQYNMAYGINAFYLPKARIAGTVTQENLFTNLAYAYQVTNYPIYAMAKSTIKTKFPGYGLTIDAGIGPNIMQTHHFGETPLDSITVPDVIFSNHTQATFSATVGAGVHVSDVFGKAPLECGYRFYYLGQGKLNQATTQVVNALKTGTMYANAVMCSITV